MDNEFKVNKTLSGQTGEQQEHRLHQELNKEISPHTHDISDIHSKVTKLAEALETLKPHDHLCLIYESEEEWRDAVIPFLGIGLKRGEKCIYIVEHSTAEEIRKYLGEEGIDIASVEKSGQLTILHETDAYTREGSFDPDRMTALLISETEKAIAEGYPALRVTGEMTWVLRGYPGSEKLLEYEAKLNRDVFPHYPCLVICQYDRWKFDPEIIKGVIVTHPLLVRGKNIYRNIYYIPPEEFLTLERGRMEAQHWLDNIEREQQLWQALGVSQQKYFELANNLNSGMAIYKAIDDGKDFVFVELNRAGERIDILNRENIIGKSVLTVFPGIKEFGLFDVFQRVWRTGIPVNHPVSLYKDNRISSWRDNYVYKLPNGEIVAIYDDITGRKKIEEKLADSEIRYRRLFETAQDAILILDGETGQIIDANPFITDLLKYPVEELTGKNLWEIGTLRDTLASKISYQVLLNTGYVRYDHLPLVDRDGRQIDVEVVANAYQVDHSKVIQCNIRDITERRLAEKALQESEIKYGNLVQNAPVGITVSTVDGRIIDANKALLEMHGYSSLDEFKQTTLSERYFNLKDRDQWVKTLHEKGIVNNLEMQLKRKDGTLFWASLNSIPNTDEEVNERFITVIQDITERKKYQEEQEKETRLESIGTLAGGIAHDFNNILTGILGNIQLAKEYMEENKGDTAREMLAEAEEASLRARDLTRQLLTFSRGGAPVRKILNIKNLIKESTTFALRGSDVKPEFEIRDDLWVVDADEGQLNQVISNLVINAVQAMPNGGIINIKADNNIVGVKQQYLRLPSGNYIEIDIKDHGIGIPKEFQDKIFDPYFTTKQKGSGLGLATTYSIIKNHGGHITFESELGKETTFHVYLPAAREQTTEKKEQEETEAKPSLSMQGRILIMDDEEIVLNLVSRILKNNGYEVTLTKKGAEAIERYTEAVQAGQPFDAVILDLTVPGGMGGKEVIARLLEIDPGVKAIVSSGYATDPIMAEFKKYGFSGVVAKPYNIRQMQEALHDILVSE